MLWKRNNQNSLNQDNTSTTIVSTSSEPNKSHVQNSSDMEFEQAPLFKHLYIYEGCYVINHKSMKQWSKLKTLCSAQRVAYSKLFLVAK
jgi:hypothetical protein